MSNIKDNSEYWAKGLTVAVDRPTLLTESPAHTSKQYYIQAENVFVVVQAPDYIPGSDGGPEVVFANGRIGLLKNLTGDVDLEGALLVANNLSDLANTAAARTNLGLGSLAIKNSVDNNDWAGVDLSIANGGTGASDAAGARSNLGLGDLATQSTVDNTDWFGDALEVSNGGTGASDAAGARTNLGLGDLSTKSTINNNDWSGVDLAVSNGGTGASDAPTARDNLGLGDAATKTVQSSSTDTAEGRLMPVGAFGLGGAVTITTTDYDTNLLTATGYYALTGSPINGPVGGSLNVHVFGTSLGGGRCWQMAQPHNVGDWYLREQFNGTWQPWKKILNQGDYGIGGNGPFVDANSVSVTGLYNCATNAPTSGSHSLYHHEYDANTAMQLAIKGGGDQLFFRRKASDSWQPWLELVKNGDSPTFPQVTLENTSDNRPSILRAFAGAGRRLLQIFSKSTSSNGAAIYLYGDDDSSSPNRILCYVGNSEAALILDPESNGGVKVRDYSGAQRRVGWVQSQVGGGTRNLALSDVNNVIRFDGTSTLTLQNIGSNGDMVQIVVVSGTLTINAGSTSLEWFQGGSGTFGNRTVAAKSVVTLYKATDNAWAIWGNGIS